MRFKTKGQEIEEAFSNPAQIAYAQPQGRFPAPIDGNDLKLCRPRKGCTC